MYECLKNESFLYLVVKVKVYRLSDKVDILFWFTLFDKPSIKQSECFLLVHFVQSTTNQTK